MTFTVTDIDNITSGRIGTFDVACPACGPGWQSARKRTKKVMRIWRVEPGFATYFCARCEIGGYARDGSAGPVDPARYARGKAEREAQERKATVERLQLVSFMWARRQPPQRSPVETYLHEVRRCRGPIPSSIGYLPPRKPEHHPAMISAFAWPIDEPEPGVMVIPNHAVRGVHLTLLRPDGLGKADTEDPKITISRCMGVPIPLAPMNDQLGLIVTEGIEDALSLHETTGIGAWAAGTANRLPALAATIPTCTDEALIAADDDATGRKGATGLFHGLTERGIPARILPMGVML
jgi:hypothetical protein